MLPRSGFRDHSFLTHAQSQQSLPERIVDLMGSGMVDIFAFEPNLCSTGLSRQPFRKVQRRWPPHKSLEKVIQFGLKGGILFRRLVFPKMPKRPRLSGT
jgi:hypothetical protein